MGWPNVVFNWQRIQILTLPKQRTQRSKLELFNYMDNFLKLHIWLLALLNKNLCFHTLIMKVKYDEMYQVLGHSLARKLKLRKCHKPIEEGKANKGENGEPKVDVSSFQLLLTWNKHQLESLQPKFPSDLISTH